VSDRGVFGLDRNVLDHEIFPDVAYSEKEAWIWLIAEAAWKKRTRRVGEYTAKLDRGQLLASVRFLAEKWKWSKSKVERFLNKLKTETMIETRTETGITIITVCNYAKYQRVSLPDETDANEISGQSRDRCGTVAGQSRDNTETIKHLNIETVDGASAPIAEKRSRKKPSRTMPDIFPMTDAHREYAAKHGYRAQVGSGFTGMTEGPAVKMFTAFKNHHAAKGSTFADWDAAWRTWVDNQAKWDSERGGPRKVGGPKL
jgi:hypothetical protein